MKSAILIIMVNIALFLILDHFERKVKTMIKDVRKYICDREKCLNYVKESVKSCTRKDLVSVISQSDLVKMDKNIRNTFFECNYDKLGNVFLFDEINPKLVSAYIVNNIELKVNTDIVYKYVCRTQMIIINEFYKKIKDGVIPWMCPLKNAQENVKYINNYKKLVSNRLNYPIKMIRGI